MTGAPFDRSLASPIARIRELRARAPGAVVAVAGMSDLQLDTYVPSEAEDRLLELATGDAAPDLIVVSGSAGGGKSALIDRVMKREPEIFEDIVQDATHADTPSTTQSDRLADFFASFADGAQERPAGRPRIVAANTGMLIQLFRQLRESGNSSFSTLEATLKFRLGISRSAPPEAPWVLSVLNLDHRPTAGEAGLLREMLPLVDFANADGVVGGAPRCATCSVRAWCPVRTNSIVASRIAPAALDTLAERVAVERGRHAGPRQLWDLTSRALTGDDPFDDAEDPCDAVASAADREDRAWVWDRLLPNALFRLSGELGERFGELDPSLRASRNGHALLARAGIKPHDDAAEITALDPGGAEALATAAEFVASGEADRGDVGRAMIAAAFLRAPGEWAVGDQVSAAFREALDEYDAFSRDTGGAFERLEAVRKLLERALGRAFGLLDGDRPFLPVNAYDPRDPSLIFVDGSLDYGDGTYQLRKDPIRQRDAQGAELAGHAPLGISVILGEVEVALTLPVYRLLRAAAEATVASTADLERFFALRRAVESLARLMGEHGRDLVVERPETDRRYSVRYSTDLSGESRLSVRELQR